MGASRRHKAGKSGQTVLQDSFSRVESALFDDIHFGLQYLKSRAEPETARREGGGRRRGRHGLLGNFHFPPSPMDMEDFWLILIEVFLNMQHAHPRALFPHLNSRQCPSTTVYSMGQWGSGSITARRRRSVAAHGRTGTVTVKSRAPLPSS